MEKKGIISRMKFGKVRSWLLLLLLLFGCMTAVPASAASSYPVQITECKLVSSSKIRVTAEMEKLSAVKGKKCYLFSLSMSENMTKSKVKPVEAKVKAKKMTFTVPLNETKSSSRLYSRFVLAVKGSNGKYSVISNAKYISNPSKAAKYKYSFPTASSKKGLQVSAGMAEDAVELNVQHSVLNIVLTEMIPYEWECNKTKSISYKYQGKTYWFRRSVIEGYDSQLVALKENNTVVSAILLLGWRDDLKYLIYPSGRVKGHSFYAWNTASQKAQAQLEAALSFLANRYGTSAAKNGRIVNWIVGNEVNNYNVYNYAGKKSLTQYARIYANAFRLTYNTVTSVYANARVYISLDHLWNTQVSGAYTSRKMLTAFVTALKRQGNIPWNLAYHPYSSPLTEPKFWENTNEQVKQALTSPVINMGNIGILTSYIRQKYGSSTRIILSEQGFTSVRHTGTANISAEEEQAAAIAYSYYLAEADDMIDSFIVNRQVDHSAEVSQGLDLGLWKRTDSSRSSEWASTQKDSWKVFKYMDTNKAKKVTSSSLSIIGIESWSEVIDGFDKEFYTKTTVTSSALQQVKNYRKTASIPSNWEKYGAVTRMSASSGVRYVLHDISRNRNCLWGFSQTFAKGISFKNHSMFYTTLKVNGYTGRTVRVKLRFFSGDHILESYGNVSAGRTVRLGVSLKNWAYRNKVTKIQVLIAPINAKWNKSASLEMKLPVRGK